MTPPSLTSPKKSLSFSTIRVSPVCRVFLLCWSLFLLAGFSLSYCLQPDPRGYGTHQTLGLPPCTIRLLWGVPCPSCGMTTSFSHFVRGQLSDSIRVNAAGFLLALMFLMQVFWSWYGLFRGCLLWPRSPLRLLLWGSGLIYFVALLQWIVWMLADLSGGHT